MQKIKTLSYKLLRKKLQTSELGFDSINELKPLKEFLGQKRAREALDFGVGIKNKGYNMYAMGPAGIGKYSLIRTLLNEYAKSMPPASDWCYIYNFVEPEKPVPLAFQAGEGNIFQQEMKQLLDELSANILAVYESNIYHADLKKIHTKIGRKLKTKDKKLMKEVVFAKICKEKYHLEKEYQEQAFRSVVSPIVRKLKKKYKDSVEIVTYLTAMENDIIEHVNDFIKTDEKTNAITFSLENPALTKYKVNLFVDNRHLVGAPVIFEDSPSYSTIFCRVEHTGQEGAPTTNFTLLRSGALPRANGGYLILEMRKLKKNMDAWEALKSALYQSQIKIKPIEHDPDAVKPVSLEPIPIPLAVKVVLLGDRNTYYSLCNSDSDFTELFKVAIDFDEQIDRNKTNIQLYARLIKTISDREKLREFSAAAVAEIIDYGSELAEDNEKLSTHIGDIEDLLLESNYWASVSKKKIIAKEDVQKALTAKLHRHDRSRELYYEDICRDFILINIKGKMVGQINCLSVRRVGNYSYGHPTRVTARARIGKGELIDIQREIKLAGPMHSKAGLIISNFLASRFGMDMQYSLSASISFEQIYCWTDGDSASVGELCALFSAIADVPIDQSLAITGSIDLYGAVQAIGGVNEKIAGFFDICKYHGLTGKQGVIIPAVNQKNLMLRDDIVDAVQNKKFSIYPIETIDDAISLLMHIPAGKVNAKGVYPKESLFGKVEAKLSEFAQKRKRNTMKD